MLFSVPEGAGRLRAGRAARIFPSRSTIAWSCSRNQRSIRQALVDVLLGEAEAQRLRDLEQAVGRRRAERRPDGVLVVALAEALDLDLVEAGEAGLERAQRLLQRFREGAADRHRLADRLHRGRQRRLGAGELLEGEARDLGDDVVDRRLERGRRRAAGDVVLDLVEGVADGEPRRDLGDREAGRLRGERRGARHARVHLDDDHAAVCRG